MFPPGLLQGEASVVSMIESCGLTKDYDGFVAVRGIDFTVDSGEFFGLLGPNGAGKTTTINILIGLARLSQGRARIAGLDVGEDMVRIKAQIGVVADESNLYDELSGYDNLCFCGSLYGLSPRLRQQRADKLLDEFGLSPARDKKFRAYSRGMKRKLTIAAALIHEPSLLFLDEPTSGIDVESVRQIRRMLQSLNNDGVTIFLTTHYIEEAERLCDRVALMVKGEIVATDSPARLIEACQHDNVLQLTVDQAAAPFLPALSQAFPSVHISEVAEATFAVTSEEILDIAPFALWFGERCARLLEARLVKPSLETAFVMLTNLDAKSMKKEKEKKGT